MSALVTVPTDDAGDVGVDVFRVKVATLLVLFEGNRAQMARHFGVTRAQPGRWLAGRDRPSSEIVRRIEDLEWVWSRLTAETTTEVARGWLATHNAFLDATPLAALRHSAAGEVVAAWDAEQAGSYA